jgi:hypothetical protein
VYHSGLKRWLQADTVDGLRGTYVEGDPVNLVDPSGRLPIQDGSGSGIAGDSRVKTLARGDGFGQISFQTNAAVLQHCRALGLKDTDQCLDDAGNVTTKFIYDWDVENGQPTGTEIMEGQEVHTGTGQANPNAWNSPYAASNGSPSPGFVRGRHRAGYLLTDPLISTQGSQGAKGNVLIGFGGSAVLLAAGQDRSSGVAVSLDSGSVNGFASNGSGAGLSGGQYGLYAGGGTYVGYIQGGPENVGGQFVNYILAVPGTNLSVTVFLNKDMQLQGAAVGYGPGIGFTRTGTSTVLVPLFRPANGP